MVNINKRYPLIQTIQSLHEQKTSLLLINYLHCMFKPIFISEGLKQLDNRDKGGALLYLYIAHTQKNIVLMPNNKFYRLSTSNTIHNCSTIVKKHYTFCT